MLSSTYNPAERIGSGATAASCHRVAEELAEFERPMPVMDEYDLLLSDTPGGIQ